VRRKDKSAVCPKIAMGEPITKAVILAAGRGKRMRELTNDIPKPMVQVRGKPVLQYIIEGLRDAGIERVLLIVGYRKEIVIDYFGKGSDFGVQIDYIEQVTQDGTGRVVELARDFCENDPFILSYGDILVDPSCYVPLTHPMDAEILVTVRHMDDVTQGGAVYLNDAFEVVDVREKLLPGEVSTLWYNAGIYTFKNSIFPYIARLEKSPRGEYELTDAIRAAAREGRKVRAIEIAGRWTDVRDPEVLADLNADRATPLQR
jgi:UDP-N-acetylglucosamine diphosphorylase / glucose-1-phosphate thymidylyltransferase / UDP-N-acetylgalactosamine diphosphorylase / glucosamine-1-phosphate N-acetyltransferase / galactosamine-1-phosphate N-acetyltransferase